MAFMNQEKKKRLAVGIKAALKKHNCAGTIRVRNGSTLVVTIRSGVLDPWTDTVIDENSPYSTVDEQEQRIANDRQRGHKEVNEKAYERVFRGNTLELMRDLVPAVQAENFDHSDSQSDYFHVGYWVTIQFGEWDKPYVMEVSNELA